MKPPRLPRRARCTLLLALATTALLNACRPSPEVAPEVVAQVGGRSITAAEVTAELKRRNVRVRSADEASVVRREALDALIQEETLVQGARAAGLDQDPEMQRRMRRLLVQEFRERHLAGTNSTPTEAALRAWYADRSNQFVEPAQVRGGLIFIRLPRKAGEEHRAAARARLETARAAILDAPDSNAAFAEAARNLSDDLATRRQGGDTGWLTDPNRTRFPEAAVQYLFSTPQIGDLSGVIEAPEGFLLARVNDRRAPRIQPFDDVRARIEAQVAGDQKEKREKEFLAQVRRGVEVREFIQHLGAIPVPPAVPQLSQQPPAVPAAPNLSPSSR